MFNLKEYINEHNQDYKEVKQDLLKNNLNALKIYSLIGTTIYGMICILSLFISTLDKLAPLCLILSLVMFTIHLLSVFVKKENKILGNIIIYFFSISLMIYGIVTGTILEASELSVSFMVFLLFVPLLFTDYGYKKIVFILISIFLYIFIAYFTQDKEVFNVNLINGIIYGIVAIIAIFVEMRIKVKRFVLEKENKKLSTIDSLTGLYNRYVLKKDINKIIDKKEELPITYCFFDINGLKKINDFFGHLKGDDMLVFAADKIKEVFGKYGKCYRIGGDEFVALIKNNDKKVEELSEELKSFTKQFISEDIHGFSISIGYSIIDDYDDIKKHVDEADIEMYKNKKTFYDNENN